MLINNYTKYLNTLPKEILIKILVQKNINFDGLNIKDCECLYEKLDNQINKIKSQKKTAFRNILTNFLDDLAKEKYANPINWKICNLLTVHIISELSSFKINIHIIYGHREISINSIKFNSSIISYKKYIYERTNNLSTGEKKDIDNKLNELTVFLQSEKIFNFIKQNHDPDILHKISHDVIIRLI